MRFRLLLATALLAGCTQPEAGPAPPSLVPPSLVVDRVGNASLQLYVHSKQGNVRYDFVNLTEHNDREVSDWSSAEVTRRTMAYAVDVVLPKPWVNLTVEVVESDVRYVWRATFDLNLTGRNPAVDVHAYDAAGDAWEPRRTLGLPFEKLLPRAPQDREAR